MNAPISWDPSLVKKFSSSNHFKLLNQLRNEVTKYPLSKKKNSSTFQTNDPNLANNTKSNIELKQNEEFYKNLSGTNDRSTNKTNVSFNNSKNFSIYNNSNISSNYDQKDNNLSTIKKYKDETSS